MHHHFHHLSPVKLVEHRLYFNKEMRGFGEDAFHAMWWLLLREFQPKLCLEIGVYRGQVISAWALISQILHYPCEVHGISPFTPTGDSVSVYREDVDYLSDTLNSFKYFNLTAPTLVTAFSTDPEAINHIACRGWNLIYIDGSHDFEIALADYRLCRDHLVSGGLLVLDDASLGTSFHPPSFSFAGHLGPSRVATEFAMKEMKFLGAVGHNNIFQKP
jgi:cephalosporin hydroxylase